jgi:PAT family beta-lactamase induction signal transducer AmpG
MTESPWRALANRRMLICVLTGFSSGLPLYLLLNLVPAWLKTEGLSLKAIGAFALIQFPYTWKFVWSPFLDRYALPLLGRRRAGWRSPCCCCSGRSPGSAPCRPPPSWGWWSGSRR